MIDNERNEQLNTSSNDNNYHMNESADSENNQQSSAYVVEGEASQQNVQPAPQQNDGQQYSSYAEFSQPSVNSMSYDPNAEIKSKKQKKVLTAIISVCCVLAIAATCIIGYSLISPGSIPQSSDSTKTTSKSSSQAEVEPTNAAKTNRELPTIYQLSAPEDALTIPQVVEKVSDSVVGISCLFSTGTGTGTGIIMSEDGYIITNAHVVNGASDITVVFTDDQENGIQAELIGIDTQTDLAVIKIDKTGLTPAEFGKSSELQVGEAAIAIGNPLGFQLAGSVTSGIISALDRELTIEDKTLTLIQTDASINSGNSGGALINAYGQVVGITSAKINSAYGEGLGFAIPIDGALPIINDLIENGYVTGRPKLGISGSDISSFYSEYYGVPQGFTVESVEEGSAAEAAGIKVGDIVVGIEGQLISGMSEFNEIKNQFSAGDTISVSLYRDGKRTDVDVTLGEATGDTAAETTTEPTTYRSFGGWGY